MTPSRRKVRFVLFFQGRTGSTYLIEALNSHPDIYAAGEWVMGEYGNKPAKQLQSAKEFFTDPSFYDLARYHAVGFKVKLTVVRDRIQLAKLLREEVGAHIILMQRRNSIKHVLSFFNSQRIYEATRDWNLYGEEDRLPPATLDVVEFGRMLKLVEDRKRELQSYVKNLKLPTLPLYYEDLLVDPRGTFRRVFSFLGVEFEPLQGESIKSTGDDLRGAISNFDELRSHYKGTPYERMFDEVLVPGL